ncbi:MAG: fibronectin type III-like domain-contianing protein, partial [Clostridia bacterium]|nr:fibronectin type III-like domain-contianing protein [Clostridia bacterium]
KTEDLPPFDDYEMKHGRTYMYRKTKPLFEFGFGLSYTTFSYENLCATQDGVEIKVTNTGDMEADEVAQLYIDSAGLPEQPRLRLKGFKRIHLKPGETVTVEFPLNDESFSLFGEDGIRRVYPGTYSVYVDGHLPDEKSRRIEIIRSE